MSPAHPGHDDLEADLRATLRGHPTPAYGPEADGLLRAVHRRASRRRARRRAIGATVVLVGLAGAGVVVTSWPPPTEPAATTASTLATTTAPTRPSSPAPTTASSPAATVTAESSSQPTRRTAPPESSSTVSSGDPVHTAGFVVQSVTAVHRAQFWVLGTGDCPDGKCQVIGHTRDAGDTFSFRTAPEPAPTSPTTAPTPTPTDTDTLLVPAETGTDLRYAVTARDAWGYAGALWATHDGGRSWAQVTLPVAATVSSVQVDGDTVWAFGSASADGAPVVFSSPVGEDLWTTADLGLLDTDRLDAPVVADGVVGALVTHEDGSVDYVRSRDAGAVWEFVAAPTGCTTPLAGSGVGDAVWLYCSGTGTAVLAVTTDAASTWAEQPLTPAAGLTTMTGIDTTHALVTDATMLSTVTVGSGAEVVDGPYASADDVWGADVGYTYAGFTDPLIGYLITSGGELARTEDGGRTWSPVDLP